MKGSKTVVITGVIALLIAVGSFMNYSIGGVTGYATAGTLGATSSLIVAAITLVLALVLFARHFNIIK